LRPGVYHARRGGTLRFDGQPVIRKQNPAVHRRLGGDPSTSTRGIPWDIRKTGSAAIECAFVAAGLLQVTRFAQPNIWDVAGGIVLAQAAGSDVFVREEGGWQPFTSFAQPTSDASAGRDADADAGAGASTGAGTGIGTGTVSRVLREWRRSLLIGEPEAVAQGCRIFS
jgi:myo-inositol-1(or 4)-monophosphatase